MDKIQQNEILYIWYKVEQGLKSYLKVKLNKLPNWAKRRNIQSLEQLHEIYRDRLVFEFEVVRKMGFLGYFLIVADLLEWCQQNNIPTGRGRGSAAGSLMTLLLKITKVDPIQYDLLFERFLNPDRVSMPDIDIDLSQAQRHLAKEYLTQKYGADRVASIGTFSKMKLRAAIKDMVRSLNPCEHPGESFKLAEKISKTLEEEDESITFSEAIRVSDSFRTYMDQYPEIAHHIQCSENILRQMSTHAAGVLISAKPLNQELPLIVSEIKKTKQKITLTTCDGSTCEKLGYLKLDTLGLKNLDVVAICKQHIKKFHGTIPKMELEGIEISPDETPRQIQKRIDQCEDLGIKMASKAFQGLRENSTLGIFQCDQSLTKDLLRKARTNSVDTISDIVALIRPGPRKSGGTDSYIARIRGEEQITYIYEQTHEYDYTKETYTGKQLEKPIIHDISIIKEICDKTQGIPIFQEQLMQISVKCANFTKGYSDVLRKAVSKKNIKLINEVGEKFIDGLVKGGAELNPNGISQTTAEYLWRKFILPYGSYGFNCINGNQLIQTKVGLVKMSELVENYNEYEVLTWTGHKIIASKIQYAQQMEDKQVFEIEFNDKSIIKATKDHLFQSNGEWKTIEQIIEQQLKIDSVDLNNILSFKRIKSVQSLGKQPVYDIEVKDYHNFILENGTIAHNCSHSISYSLLAYEEAWLKANYPGEFYAAVLACEDPSKKTGVEKINATILEAKAAGIKFLPPNINKSTDSFEIINPTTITYSLTCLKGVGEKAAPKIIETRPYKNMIDFLGRTDVDAKVIKALIKGGTFDDAFEDEKVNRKNYYDFFEDAKTKIKRQVDRLLRNRLASMFNYNKLRGSELKTAKEDGTHESPAQFHKRMMEDEKYIAEYKKQSIEILHNFVYDWTGPLTEFNQGVVKAVPRASGDNREQWDEKDIFDFEEEIYGTTITKHRLDPYQQKEQIFKQQAEERQVTVISSIDDLSLFEKDQIVYLFCLGVELTLKKAYKADPKQYIRIFTVEDRHGKIKVTMFDKTFNFLLKKNQINPFTIMAKKLPYRPVMILKCKINEYLGMRSLMFEGLIDWTNEKEIKQDFENAKKKELPKQEEIV